MLVNKILKNIVLIGCGVLFSSCAVFSGYDSPNYQKKVLLDNDSCGMLTTFDENDDLVYNGSYYGLLARTCKDYKLSVEIFDKVENQYKKEEDLEGNASKAFKAVGTFLVNDTIKDYQSYDFERSMINIYKALNFMSLNDYDSARAELNRALIRDSILAEKFDFMNKTSTKEFKQSNANRKDNLDDILKDLDSDFDKYKMYKNNINPFGKYLSSVFFMIDGDANKASELLRELMIEYNGENAVIKNDYLLAEKLAKSSMLKNKYIWLIYENGLSPTIVTNYFPYTYSNAVTIAAVGVSVATNSSAPAFVALMNHTNVLSVPMMDEGISSFEYLNINGKNTQIVSNMNLVMANELKQRLPSTITKIIYSNITKDLITMGVGMVGGGALGMLGADIYKQATNTADTRMFIGLPNTIDVARVDNNGKITIKDDENNVIFEQNVDKNKNVIVYVKSSDINKASFYVIEK